MKFDLFVFGTLKAGFPNHHLNTGQRLGGRFRSVQPYPLLLVGERCSPWLIDAPGEGLCVTGEVWRVDIEGLYRMDRLERIREADGYRRRPLEVYDEQSGSRFLVEAYLKPPAQLLALPEDAIHSGPHAEYGPELAALYRPRNQAPKAF